MDPVSRYKHLLKQSTEAFFQKDYCRIAEFARELEQIGKEHDVPVAEKLGRDLRDEALKAIAFREQIEAYGDK